MEDETAEKIGRNNAVFRAANDEIAQAVTDSGLDDGRRAPFVCECADPRCTAIIRMTFGEYSRVRSNARWFAHAKGHETEVPGAVEVVEDRGEYVLVQKIGRAGEIAEDLADGGGEGLAAAHG